ncbi:hypothetical protein TWF694_009228 [Orbilia ellipsospora]|uniref:NmrA-like domain-containing protein n=1 Tax=Orbilia ellipsospora TaxID=2528407 RepID=A0AAV9XEV5_9PEZI
MASTLKNVAIIGASGSIGKIILGGLIDSAQFNVTAISRNTSDVTFPSGVAVIKTDFSDEGLVAAFKGQDVVISAVGATAFGEQKKLVDAALRAGVKRFIPSEFSVSSQNQAVLQLLPLFAQKKELVDYLRSKESEGLTWTGLATSGLLDWGIENGFLEFDLANRTATIWDGGNKSFTCTNEKQLGQAVVSVLQHPQETSNQYLFVASVETTQNEIIAALEEVSGESWTVTHTTTDTQVNEGFKKLQAGDFSGAFALVRATAFGNTPGLHANYAKDEKLANDILGLSLEDVKDVVKRVLKK